MGFLRFHHVKMSLDEWRMVSADEHMDHALNYLKDSHDTSMDALARHECIGWGLLHIEYARALREGLVPTPR